MSKKQVAETSRRILADLVARVVFGDRYDSVTDAERAAVAERYEGLIEGAARMVDECLAQAGAEAIQTVHKALHDNTILEPEMLDQAIEYAEIAEED